MQKVNENKAQRLAEYNTVFLQDQLYFASRHRIVKADTKVLLEDDDFVVTPFSDVEPIYIKQGSVQRGQDQTYWHGLVQTKHQSELDAYGISLRTTISMHAWDLDEFGNAHLSMMNRFKHSPRWKIDETNTPILEVPAEGQIGTTGPPPLTPEDIERHKRLKKLNKRKFHSVSATFSTLDGKKYVLAPLKYTPKYSVIYEIDPNKVFLTQFDYPSETEDVRSHGEIMQTLQYQTFREGLPKEVNKAVKGDIE